MANMIHTCENCGKQLTVPDRYLGRNLKCPHCGTAFRPEQPTPAPPAQPAPPESPPYAPAAGPGPFAAPAPAAAPSAGEPQFTAEPGVRFTLKHIDVVSAAKVSAAMHGLLGFALGVLFAVRVLFVPMQLTNRTLFALGKGATALLAVVVVPGSCAIAGLVVGAALAGLYNLTVKLFSAVEVELE